MKKKQLMLHMKIFKIEYLKYEKEKKKGKIKNAKKK